MKKWEIFGEFNTLCIFQSMFLAIINDTYTEVKAELEAQKAERLVGDYFKKGYKNVINNVTGKGTVFGNHLN